MNISANTNEQLGSYPTAGVDPDGTRERIARLNDDCRQGRSRPGTARIVMTQGIAALLSDKNGAGDEILGRLGLMRMIAAFDFPEGDASGERDFGGFQLYGADILFKIDYYDRDLISGSEDPSDDRVTTRVLSIMLAREY